MTLHGRLLVPVFISLSILLFCGSSYPADMKLVLLTSGEGVLLSNDGGKNWDSLNRGLPHDFIPQYIQGDSAGNLLLSTRSSGIFYFEASTGRWADINSDLLLAPLPSDGVKEYRKISAMALSNDGTIVAATKHDVFRKGKGRSWEKVQSYPGENYCTALAADKNAVYAGTGCNGIYRLQNSRAIKLSSNLPREQYSKKYYFYEDVAAIEQEDGNGNILYAGLNFGGGVYYTANGGTSWHTLNFPTPEKTLGSIFDIKAQGGALFVSSSDGIFRMDRNHQWQSLRMDDLLKRLSSEKENLSVLVMDNAKNCPPLFYRLNDFRIRKDSVLAEKAASRKALYTNAYSVNRNLQSYIDTIKKCGLNAIVIDVKDDWGDICFASENKTALEIGAVKKYFDINKILSVLKKNRIYTIARIVVFKDRRIYNAYNNKYAIWDSAGNSPWKGNPREYWNDPYSEFVRNYNISVAEEAERAGFDEIQFDYIRFPSDGPIDRCVYRYKENKNFYKSEILAHFLKETKRRIKIPLSVDIYGFNAWFRMGNKIGQDAERFSEIADVVCPMVYPSHYGRKFFAGMAESVKPYRIVLDNTARGRKITKDNAVIRPYLQAFKLLSPTWGPDYIKIQVKAATKSGGSGYTFWNAGGDYSMVRKAIADSGAK